MKTKEKTKRQRNTSIFTVFLWLMLIAVMSVITVSGMKEKNALETDKSDGLTVTDFILTNATTGEEKSDIVGITRGEYLQLKIKLDYNGEALKVGDKLTFSITQNNSFSNNLFTFSNITISTPIYDSNNVELGTYTFNRSGAKFIITMSRDVTNFENIEIITNNTFIRRSPVHVAMTSGNLANLVVKDNSKNFLLESEELKAISTSVKIGMTTGAISNNYVMWGINSHYYEEFENAKLPNTDIATFKDSIVESRFTNVVEDITFDDISNTCVLHMPATNCDGLAVNSWGLCNIDEYLKKVYQEENESYEEFRARVKASGPWSIGIYEHSDTDYSFIFYQGDLEDAPVTYEELCQKYYNTTDIASVLEENYIIGGLTDEQKTYLNSVYSSSNSTQGKVQAIQFMITAIYESVSKDTMITQEAKLTDDSGEYIQSFEATLTPNYGLGSASTFSTVTKIWNDDGNSKGLRPQKAEIIIYQNDVEYQKVTLTADNEVNGNSSKWQTTLNNLPEYDENGNQYIYIAKEQKVTLENGDEYSPSITGSTVKNTLTGKTSYTVTKVWDDNNNAAGKRPDEVTIILKANGEEVRRQKITSIDGWKYTFNNLDKYDENGTQIIYTVDEELESGFYQKSISENVITNTFSVPDAKVSIEGKKVWDDNNNEAGKRPNSIILQVKNGSKLITEHEITGENGWQYTFSNLDKYDSLGNEIIYTIDEKETNAFYTKTIVGNTITNTFTVPEDKVEIEVIKTWDDNNNAAGKRPENIILQVKNGDEVVAEEIVNETNEWKHTFKLPKYDKLGNEIEYTVDEKETNRDFYVKNIVGNVITNKFVVPDDRIKIIGTKEWDDTNNIANKREETVILQVKVGEEVVAEGEVSETNNWTYEFELAKYDELGNEIEYKLDEREIENKFYEKVEVENTDMLNQKVLNKFIVPEEKVLIKASKLWKDNNNVYQKRPTKVTLQVKNGDKVVDEVVVNEDNNWGYEFELPKYDELGNEIEYTVDEKKTSKYYEKSIEGYTVINTCTYNPQVDTSDINIWIYVIVSIVAIVGVIIGIVIIKNNKNKR